MVNIYNAKNTHECDSRKAAQLIGAMRSISQHRETTRTTLRNLVEEV